ncbi:Mannose-1-phosphate guanylyltransferase (GDP) [Christiangramia flava JLT2011]|uniref:Mannose-1-phosphate guanylyltransferase (GDP) n=1 Tax=Christiangramia flava JLT2011 TaxID=1229726 RepID=A0A1L7I4V3_9FLAO|nr:Mannose-1-phosphate guanylyltransferase (GDP) [Christiangramia flava JLT2011]OSS38171.1 Mannose-1-phosphate guanylyltransferase (GDP) [Christiangramia flava JLT2011]
MWPLSRKARPKQYADIFGGDSLFELTVKRNQALTDELCVVGNIENDQLSKGSLSRLGVVTNHHIVETTPRNTAAAIAFAAFSVEKDDMLLITPSDHIIAEGPQYDLAIEKAKELAKKGSIVTFGIQPTKPETGYGYIEYNGTEVKSFREKPNKETAQDFIRSGNFLWNSGMFCFKAGVFLEELKKFEPDVYDQSRNVLENTESDFLDLDLSMKIPSISVDYAVMERSDKIKVVPSSFKWSDMGSFESVYEYLQSQGHPVDENGNMSIGCNKFTSFVGLKNSIFVATEDANLILQKEDSQEVKVVYKNLEKEYSDLT